jgi:hypothetical protein
MAKAKPRFGKATPQRVSAAVAFGIGVLALLVQFFIVLIARANFGAPVSDSVIYFFSSFTVLANITVMFIYAGSLFTRSGGLEAFRQPVVRGMAAGAMLLAAGFYYLVLGPAWRPEGLYLVCDWALNIIDPAIYILWWGIFCTRGRLKYRDISAMLIPPLIYLCYVMVRGELVGEYPYPVLDAARLGYGQVAINVIAVLAILSVLCAIMVSIDRAVGHLRR